MNFNNLNIAVVDTETTGLDCNKHEVIEIGVLVYNQQTDTIISEWDVKIKPRYIETAQDEALKINGYLEHPHLYTNNIYDTIIEFNSIVKDCIVLGQNIQFDLDMLKKYYNEFKISDPFHRHRKLELTSVVWPIIRQSELTSMSLHSLCKYAGISNKNEHRALSDCHRTLEVYKWAMKKLTPVLT